MDHNSSSYDQRSKTTNYEPGWNDPPNLSFNPVQPSVNKPRLNKRVAFPFSGTTSSTMPTPPINLRPLPTAYVPPIHSNPKALVNSEVQSIDIESETTLEEVKEILLNILEDNSELAPKASDVKRRLDVMEDMWSTGKLNMQVQGKMKELVKALQDNQPNKADDIHRFLMVDHIGAVSSWMPGVKLLIRNCIARSELLAIDKE